MAEEKILSSEPSTSGNFISPGIIGGTSSTVSNKWIMHFYLTEKK